MTETTPRDQTNETPALEADQPRKGAIGKALLVWLGTGSIGAALLAFLLFRSMGC